MCGIAGIITRHQDRLRPRLLAAERVQRHRGPDRQAIGEYPVGHWAVGLGHQRLAILDLTGAGDQPMTSRDSRSVIVYNGEIYNYLELREELLRLGHSFASSGDTEVLLAALGQWGIGGAQPRLNGMWAYAYLDIAKQRVVLCRDRAGVKPLYYYQTSGELYFASELKTILAMVGGKFVLNEETVAAFLTQSLIDINDESMLKGIRQVPAGHFAVVDLSSATLSLNMQCYWQVSAEAQEFSSPREAVERLREIFSDAVRIRLRSDVPVGVLLSGGIDSSAIAAVMDRLVDRGTDLNLLSAVSADARYDESSFIDQVGAHLNRRVHKVRLDPDPASLFALLKTASWFNDGPVGSFSVVLHHLLMQRARELKTTVILSGQGADELLCGYKKYLGFYLQYLMRKGRVGRAVSVLAQFCRRGTIVGQFNMAEAKRYLPGIFRLGDADVRGERLKDQPRIFMGLSPRMTVPQRQALDLERFSVPALTHYEDRMSMAASREIRLPYLDYRLMDLLVPLSVDQKMYQGWTKYLFREAVSPWLPKEIAWRKDKQGFINPQPEWLKNELRPEVTAVFGDNNALMYRLGLVNQDSLMVKYRRYCTQSLDSGSIWYRDVFNPLALEIWLREYEKFIQ